MSYYRERSTKVVKGKWISHSQITRGWNSTWQNLRPLYFHLSCFKDENTSLLFVFCLFYDKLKFINIHVFLYGVPLSLILPNLSITTNNNIHLTSPFQGDLFSVKSSLDFLHLFTRYLSVLLEGSVLYCWWDSTLNWLWKDSQPFVPVTSSSHHISHYNPTTLPWTYTSCRMLYNSVKLKKKMKVTLRWRRYSYLYYINYILNLLLTDYTPLTSPSSKVSSDSLSNTSDFDPVTQSRLLLFNSLNPILNLYPTDLDN